MVVDWLLPAKPACIFGLVVVGNRGNWWHGYGYFFGSHSDQTNQSASSGGSSSRIGGLETQVRELTIGVDRMSLACQALWELLEARTEMSDTLLSEKMTEIDLRDGVRDGQIAMSVLVCPNCGNRSNSRRQQCIFCGRTVPSEHIFG